MLDNGCEVSTIWNGYEPSLNKRTNVYVFFESIIRSCAREIETIISTCAREIETIV